jgi:hypothetical protein
VVRWTGERRMTRVVKSLAWLLVGSLAGGAGTMAAPERPTLSAHLEATSRTIDPRAAAALRHIDGPDRRLLALRSYLRSARQIEERWSWSRAELAAAEGSQAQARYVAAVAQVRCVFEARHPGYTLYANPEVRSLEVQLQAWNDNASVGRAAARMQADLARAVARPGFPRPGTPAGHDAFRALLVNYRPSPAPTLAAPGLSRHGRMQAIDFQVRRGARTVAAPRASTVASDWHAGGWSARLAEAISLADVGLTGPLRSPDEPWHYELAAQPSGDLKSVARIRRARNHACT